MSNIPPYPYFSSSYDVASENLRPGVKSSTPVSHVGITHTHTHTRTHIRTHIRTDRAHMCVCDMRYKDTTDDNYPP